MKKRLRGYAEPITLFGETDLQRLNRLKLYELNLHDKQTSSHGASNLFQQLQADVESEINAAILNDLEAARAAEDGQTHANGDGVGNSKETEGTVTFADKGDEDDDMDDGKKKKVDYRYKEMKRDDFDSTEEFIIYFFKRMLSEWESDLDSRPKELKRSTRGKIDAATQKQTRSYLKPFFKLLKTHTCDKEILQHTESIVRCCLQRDYIQANEHYLTMAIGNAPW